MPVIRQAALQKQSLNQRRRAPHLNICTTIEPDVDAVIEGTEEQRGRKLKRTYNTRAPRARLCAPGELPGSNKGSVVRELIHSPYERPAAPLPAFTLTTPKDAKSYIDREAEDLNRTPVPTAPSTPELKDLHDIFPGLSIAVATVSCSSTLHPSIKKGYTHVVRVAHSEKRDAWTERDEESSIEILNVTYPTAVSPPPAMRVTKTGRRVRNLGVEIEDTVRRDMTGCSTDQLQVARDFISLYLPYYAIANPPSPSIPKCAATPARMLLIAPTHVDAISIVVTYLAFCSGEHAFTVIQYIDEEQDEAPDAWRNIFPIISPPSPEDLVVYYGEGAEKVEVAARLDA